MEVTSITRRRLFVLEQLLHEGGFAFLIIQLLWAFTYMKQKKMQCFVP